MSLHGTAAGSPVDLYSDKVAPSEVIDLGTVNLTEGANTIGLDATGKNDKLSSYLVGIDYFKFVPEQ